MGLIGAVAGAVETIANGVAGVAGLLTGLDGHNGFTAQQSLDGLIPPGLISPLPAVGMPNPMALGDGPTITADDVNRSDAIIPGMIGAKKADLLIAGKIQAQNEADVLAMPMMALGRGTPEYVTMTSISKYNFSDKETDFSSEIINIKYNDHMYYHLIPSQFKAYQLLLNHDFFHLNSITIESTQSSPDDVSTFIGFFPTTKNTQKVSNETLRQAAHAKVEQSKESFKYTIFYPTPGMVNYKKDKYNEYVDITPQSPFLNPNLIVRSDACKLFKKNVVTGGDIVEDGEDLSYGTLIVMKNNMDTSKTVGVTIKITMNFQVWDLLMTGLSLSRTATMQGDTEDDIDIPSGSGSGEGDDGDGEGDDGQGGDGDQGGEDGDGSGSGEDGSGSAPGQGATATATACRRSRRRKN